MSFKWIDDGIYCLPYKLIVFFCCLFTLACNRESGIEPMSDDTNSEAIQLGASVNLQTRATDAGFELNDSIGLYLTKWQDASTPGNLAGTGNYADNALFRLSSQPDSWTTPQTLYYPADGSKLDFYAYYPYREPAFGTGTILNLTVAPDQSDYYHYTRSDFMLAKTEGVKRSNSKVHLDFYHQLAQIVFVLKPGTGFTLNDLKNAKVKIVNAIVDGTFNLSSDTDTIPVAGSTRQDITPCGSWTEDNGNLSSVMAILMPQYINTTTYVEVTIGNRRFTFKPSDAIHMNPGCSREFTITVNNTGIDIETEIHPWNTCPAVNGEATEEEDTPENEWIVKMTTAKQAVSLYVNLNSGIRVDWGDGTVDTNGTVPLDQEKFSHNYATEVSHEITVYGSREAITFFASMDCGLETLDISRNLKLETLICWTGQLKLLDVTRNLTLKTLSCAENQLTNIDITNNPVLTKLYCESNQLESIDISNNKELTKLYCTGNRIKNIDISNNLALTDFNCEGNLLESVDISNNIELTYLFCSNNQLTVIDINKNTKLETLECWGNLLNTLDISKNMEIRKIYCTGNPMVSNISEMTALANALPDRTEETGSLRIENETSKAAILSICDGKEWRIR